MPLINNYVAVPDMYSYFSKNQFGEVRIVFKLKKADQSEFTSGVFGVAVLPEGFRPAVECYGTAHIHSGISAFPCSLSMHPTDGVLVIHIHCTQNEDILIGNIMYDAKE